MPIEELLQSRQFLTTAAVWLAIGVALAILYGWFRESKILYKVFSSLGFLFVWPVYFPIWLAVGTYRRIQTGESLGAAIIAQLSVVRRGQDADQVDRLEVFDVNGDSMESRLRKNRRAGESTGLVLAHSIVEDAVLRRASDILIHPSNEEYSVRFRVNGSLRNIDEYSDAEGRSIVNCIKTMSGMDIADRRRPQDGGFVGRLDENARISFRVATAGVLNGEKVSIRVLDQSAAIFTLGSVGLSNHEQETIKQALYRQSGMVLICGPTGSGKSSTVHAMLRTIDSVQRNVITIEDPIEYVLPNASQIEINKKAGITFAETLRSVLRQDPDVISVGEIRDPETAGIALQAAQTGHLVFATVHSESNLASLLRLIDLGCDPNLIGSAVKLVVSQRLVRRLCDHCKKPATFSDAQKASLAKQHLDPNALFQSVGCQHCSGTGFGSRSGVFDILPINDDIRSKLASSSLQDKSSGQMSSIQVRATQLALAGMTTWEEVLRVSCTIE